MIDTHKSFHLPLSRPLFYFFRGIPVSTSLGFCFTLIALLAMDLVGDREDYFIRTISEAELSTPEDYLKSMDVTSNTESSSDEDDVEKALNEETPLMA